MFEEIADEAFIEERPDNEAMIEDVSDDKKKNSTIAKTQQ